MKVLEVNKSDLKNNLDIIKDMILNKKSDTQIIAVVKANRNGFRLNRIF